MVPIPAVWVTNREIWKLGKYSVPAVLESSLFGSGFSLLFLEQLSSPGASRRDEGGAVSALSSRFPNCFSEMSTVFGAARAGLELSQNWDRPRDSRSFPGREGRVCPKGFGTSALNPAQSAPIVPTTKSAWKGNFHGAWSDRIRGNGFRIKD